jgi:uncharacterized protein (DUF362 family)
LKDTITRRRFLGTLGATAAGLAIAPRLARSMNDAIVSNVAVTSGDNYGRTFIKEKVQHLFDALGGISDVVKAGDKVAIKINLTGGSGSASSSALHGVPITESMWTHPEVVRAVGELLIDCGVNGSDISIVEALWDDASYNNFGYLTVQQSLGANKVNLNNAAPYAAFITRDVGNLKFYWSSFTLNQILADVDVYVSIPKMKHHTSAGFTGALKNQIGITPKALYETSANHGRREALHSQGSSEGTQLPRSVCDLNLARPVHLAVIDGIKNAHGGEGVWNGTFQLAEDHVLLAGKEPVATDTVAAHIIGLDPGAAKFPLPQGGECDNHLYLLHQKGVGTNQLGEIAIVGDGANLVSVERPRAEGRLPDHFELLANYPNPFNPSTMISFFLPHAGQVVVEVFSSSGQRIETLVNAEMSQGIHHLQWDARNYASGVYFCRAYAGAESRMAKMLYQK